MVALFASSLLVQIFGDTPTKIALNGALVAIIAYWLWRVALKPPQHWKKNNYTKINKY